MLSSQTIAIIIKAQLKAQALKKAQTQMTKLQKVGKKAAAVLKAGFKRVGAAISAATGFVKSAVKWFLILGALPAALFIGAVKNAADFEQAMANVQAVLGGTTEDMRQVANAAREMGRTTIFTAQEAASAMYDLASAGFSADQVISALRGTMLLAAATNSDLTFTAETMTSVIKQFSLEASEADRVANVFAASISFSKLNMDRLSTSMAFAGPVASSLGMSLEGTVATLSQFANMGLRASMIGTTFRMGLLQLGKAMPTEMIESGAEVLKRLGVQFKEIDPSMNSVADIVETLSGKVTTMTEAVALFGVRAGGPWLKMIKEGAEPLRVMEAKITATNKAAEAAAIQINTFRGKLKLLRSAFQGAQEGFGKQFLPILGEAVEKTTEWVNVIGRVDWGAFWTAFQSGSEEGTESVNGILNMFRSGGAFRNVIVDAAAFMAHTMVDAAKIMFQPIETEFQISLLKGIEGFVKKMRSTWSGGKLLKLMGISDSVSSLAFGDKAQAVFRKGRDRQFKEQIDNFIKNSATGVGGLAGKTGDAVTKAAGILSGGAAPLTAASVAPTATRVTVEASQRASVWAGATAREARKQASRANQSRFSGFQLSNRGSMAMAPKDPHDVLTALVEERKAATDYISKVSSMFTGMEETIQQLTADTRGEVKVLETKIRSLVAKQKMGLSDGKALIGALD